MPLFEALFVALGAFVGAISRVGISHLSQKFVIKGMPVATLSLNIGGSFTLGFILPTLTFPNPAFWFLVIGFLSSLTTFSTFVMELDELWNTNQKHAVQYAICSLSLGFLSLVTGFVVGHSILTNI